MLLRLLARQPALPAQLLDQRVVARELAQLAVAQQVGAAVADVHDRDLVVGDQRAGRASSPSRCGSSPRCASSKIRRLASRDARELLLRAAVVRALPRRPRPRSATRPRRPGRRPCRRRPRRPARARDRSPRWRGADARYRCARPPRRPSASAVDLLEPELGVADADPVARPQHLLGAERACRSRRCRWSSPCPRCRRRPPARTAARGGRTRTCPRSGCRRAGERPIVDAAARARTPRRSQARRRPRPPAARVRPRVVRAALGSRRLIGRRPPEVPQRAARHPQQEQVEHRDEGELSRTATGSDIWSSVAQSTSNRMLEVPTDDLVAGRELALAVTRRPLTATPLVDSRSTTYQSAPRCGARSAGARRWGRRARSRCAGCGPPPLAAGRSRRSCRPRDQQRAGRRLLGAPAPRPPGAPCAAE